MLFKKRIMPISILIIVLIEIFGCGPKGDQNIPTPNPPAPPSAANVKVFNVDEKADLIRPFSDKDIWIASRKKNNFAAYFVDDKFVALDARKFADRFEAGDDIVVIDVVMDRLENVYFGAQRVKGGKLKNAAVQMLKASGKKDPEDATHWYAIQDGEVDSPTRYKGGSILYALAMDLNDILIGEPSGIQLGKIRPEGPLFEDGGTRRSAAVFSLEKLVTANFPKNNYLAFSEASGSQKISAFDPALSGLDTPASSEVTLSDTAFSGLSMTTTNNGKAIWVGSSDHNKLARVVFNPADNKIAVSEELTHASTGLDSSPIMSFAAIHSNTFAILQNGKLYRIDETTITQEGNTIKNKTAVRFTEVKDNKITLNEARDLQAQGTTLWILSKEKALRVENAQNLK